MNNVDEAIANVERAFPIPGYTRQNVAAYRTLAYVALEYLSPASRILDIGSGPCDKAAVLQQLGFRCVAVDDLNDPWHKEGDATEKILDFARDSGIEFHRAEATGLPFEGSSFDMVMLCDVIEHLHHSPRELLIAAISAVRPHGFLVITVPNAVNLRKRLHVLVGKTNLPPFDAYYWWPGEWRGHVREYVRGDLDQLARLLGIEILELRGVNHMLENLPRIMRRPFVHMTHFAHGLRDSWLLVARRPEGWKPVRERKD
jgi:SAM-dependent methyltransferase